MYVQVYFNALANRLLRILIIKAFVSTEANNSSSGTSTSLILLLQSGEIFINKRDDSTDIISFSIQFKTLFFQVFLYGNQ